MPNIKDQIGDVVGGLVNSEPAVQISKGIAAVGEKASGAYDSAKGWVKRQIESATPPKATMPADIELPKERKRKIARPQPYVSRAKSPSLSSRR